MIRQCIQPACPNYYQRQCPEEEGRWALPHREFGLDIIALIPPSRRKNQDAFAH
ncbi:hypothetical protein [Ktedonobacter racemifer]|uniref:hypothetical protein n=1 Tax=Ktedonobacter racemifer TaxID=363277 RepID=UPI0012F9A6B7|nr:hypothetical protein [Ktedonobacter racemifer]